MQSREIPLFLAVFHFRPCDSRNLNLSPLCMLNGGTLPRYWMEEVTWMKTYIGHFVCSIGEGDLRHIRQPKPILHIVIAKSNEAKAHGQLAHFKVNGEISKLGY